MFTQYLKSDGTAGTFAERAFFTAKAAATEAAERGGVAESETHQPGIPQGDYALVERWRVRLTLTSLDRAMARRSGVTPIHAENLAQALVNPRSAGVRCVPEQDATQGALTHCLQFTRPVGYDFKAYFTPSTCGTLVYVRTVNWKYEDEYHGWVRADHARALWRRMASAGFEAF